MGLANGTTRKALPDIVFERMHRAIKSGAYRPDERLPTEHDLAAEFEVSRPVIREALKRLRDQGLIYSRRGAGSFVRALGLREPLGFGQLENVADLLNCYEFRLTLEPAAAAAAAARADAAGLTAIRQALELMRDATNRQSHREDADYQFHLAIARAAQNNYFSTAMEALKDHIAVGMKFHGVSVKREAAGLARVFAEHEAIAEAIAARDGAGARKLMESHLNGSRERLFQSSHQLL
ncbi:GntR family transcriptional regulator [Xaviernesmea oryzae]|uniref:GntR family transcriptional regulator n=1 Tax=Xaviernesmea oryzae TaxID=464029 RepID=A0A1Q9B120_9HYPH|nr:FadR/GntR family transcriptional regulator [Xaviernesmea oryzae]OLP61648.1 GntR family transcriptional regulator [Xaviernesmea oryzae]